MNNKGFMMAEVVVVSSIILVALAAFYSSYNKIISIYNQRIDYYDVPTLYRLAYLMENDVDLIESDVSTSPITRDSDSDYVEEGECVYLVEFGVLKNDTFFSSVANSTFKDYFKYLSTSLDFDDSDTLFVFEKCDSDGKSNCKYAYLEVY